MQNENGNREDKKSVMATPVSIPKHPSTQRSVCDELSSSTQASVVSHSPQVEEYFFPLHSAHGKALKHPGRWNLAAEMMGSTPVTTTRGDPVIQLLERSRAESNRPISPQSGYRPFNDIANVSILPFDLTAKVDSDLI